MNKSIVKYLLAVVVAAVVSMWIMGRLLLLSDAASKKSPPATVATSSDKIVAQPVVVLEWKITTPKEGGIVTGLPAIAQPPQLPGLLTPLADVSPERVSQSIGVTFVVEHSTSTFSVSEGSTALDLMLKASSSKTVTFTSKEYSGLGTLITSINGKVSNQNRNDLYWIYSVNGKKATVGVSQYVLHDGDVVSWSYEPSTM